MKRYLLFVYPNYYPSGGWGDFVAAFDSVGQAKERASAEGNRYNFEIVDVEALEVVESGDIYSLTRR